MELIFSSQVDEDWYRSKASCSFFKSGLIKVSPALAFMLFKDHIALFQGVFQAEESQCFLFPCMLDFCLSQSSSLEKSSSILIFLLYPQAVVENYISSPQIPVKNHLSKECCAMRRIILATICCTTHLFYMDIILSLIHI